MQKKASSERSVIHSQFRVTRKEGTGSEENFAFANDVFGIDVDGIFTRKNFPQVGINVDIGIDIARSVESQNANAFDLNAIAFVTKSTNLTLEECC